MGCITVSVAEAVLPVPTPLPPTTVYVVSTDGVTVQVAAVVPAQVPPVHANVIAPGLQLAESVELLPTTIDAGLAVKVQVGGCVAGVTVTVADAVLPAPIPLVPLNV